MRIRISKELKYELRRLSVSYGKHIPKIIAAYLLWYVSYVLFFPSHLGIRLEQFTLQQFYAQRGSRPPPTDVVIVAIDDNSYKKFDATTNFPLPRKYIAAALESINSAEPKLLIIDGKFPKDRLIDPDADARIEAAIRAGNTTIWDGRQAVGISSDSDGIAMPSDEPFRKAAKMELSMQLSQQLDQVLEISPALDDREMENGRLQIPDALKQLGQIAIDPPPSPRDFINYYGSSGWINRISLVDLVEGDVAAAQAKLTDKIVLMGYQSLNFGKGTSGKDEFGVPSSKQGMFGVEIHASVVGNLLDRSWLRRFGSEAERITLALIIVFMAWYIMHVNKPRTFAIIFAVIALTYVAAYFAFAYYNLWITGLATVTAAAFFALVMSALYFFLEAEKYRQYIAKTFSFEKEKEL